MTDRAQVALLVIVMAAGLAGCEGGGPTRPSTLQQPNVTPPTGGPPGVSALNGVTLYGVVTETTPAGPVPIEDVSVYCDACGEFGHTWARTDANGYYSFSGDLAAGGGIWLGDGPILLAVRKEGYDDPPDLPPASTRLPSGPGWREVTIGGDTRFDVQLVRR